MANLIDSTYFVLDTNVPSSDYSNLGTHIARYEPEILTKALGYDLYQLVIEYATGEQRIKDIVEGKSYTTGTGDDLRTVHWNGLVNDEKISLIDYYVYYWWLRNNAQTILLTGIAESTFENAIVGGYGQLVSNTWQNLTKLYGGFCGEKFLNPSLYNFLTKYSSTYPEWEFTRLGNINNFNL